MISKKIVIIFMHYKMHIYLIENKDILMMNHLTVYNIIMILLC
jgi:hypothetical protein